MSNWHEYYKSIKKIDKKVRVITPVFKERKGIEYKVVNSVMTEEHRIRAFLNSN